MQSPNLKDSKSLSSQPLVRGARLALGLLLAINLFNYIDRQVLAGVVRKIQAEFNVSDALAGALAPAFLVSYMVTAPLLFGWLADRYNRWVLVGAGVVLWSLASGASGLATVFGALLVTRLFVGVGEAAYGPTAPTILSDLFPIEKRGQVLAWFYAAIPVGSALGYLLASIVGSLGLSWRWAFYCVVPPGILLGVAAWFLRRLDRRTADDGAPASSDVPAVERRHVKFRDYRVLLRTRSYVLTTIGMTALTFGLGGVGFWMPKYIVWREGQAGAVDLTNDAAVRSAEDQANGIFGPVVAVSGLVGTLIGGWVGDRLRPRWPGAYLSVSGVAMLISFPLFLAVLVTPFPAAWILVFLTCFAMFFNTGPSNTVLANVVHPSLRAAGFAVNIFVIHTLGDAISPPLIGLLNDAFGTHQPGVWSGNMNAGFLAISATILIGAVAWLWGSRYLEQDTARAMHSLDE